MPIGKDSIQNRVAKAAVVEDGEVKVASGTENTPAEAKPATPRKKSAPKASGETAPKAPAKKKPAAPKAEPTAAPSSVPASAEPISTEPAVAVLSNVAPETVEAVVGHKEDKPADKIQVGQKMPHFLL